MSDLDAVMVNLFEMTSRGALAQVWNCHHGRHVTVQMDGSCVFCDARVSGNPTASPDNSPVLTDRQIYRRARRR